MSDHVHLTPEQTDRLEKINADNVAALSVHIRIKGVWLIGLMLRLGAMAEWLRLSSRKRTAAWVAWAAGRLRARTRIGRRGKWADAGPIGLDEATKALETEVATLAREMATR